MITILLVIIAIACLPLALGVSFVIGVWLLEWTCKALFWATCPIWGPFWLLSRGKVEDGPITLAEQIGYPLLFVFLPIVLFVAAGMAGWI